jgi:hypothetical protein
MVHGRLDAVVARLRPGVGVETARQELSGMAGPSAAGRLVTVRRVKDVVTGSTRIHFNHPTWREDRNDPATARRRPPSKRAY